MSEQCFNMMPAGMESDIDDDDQEDGFYKDLSVRKTCENLKITIVPDITSNAGLNGQSFDATLEPDIKQWMDQLKSSVSNKRGPTLTNALLLFYAQCSNPFLYCLKMYANCSGINPLKSNSFAFALLEELYNYKKAHEIDANHFVDENLKMVAFNFVKKQSQQNVYKLIVLTFDLISHRHLFVDKLRELLNKHCYKEVCQFANELHLYDEFTIYEFILPLILQDKISIVEGYLCKAIHLQQPLIELLDSLLEKSQSLHTNCSYYISKYNYPDIKLYKLQSKPLMKLISRLGKMYNLPTDVMPNVVKMKTYGALQFLLNKQYSEKCLNRDSWQEMVKETVPADSMDLQIELVMGCFYNRDYVEAAYWANYYNVSANDLPMLVKDAMRQSTHSRILSPDKNEQIKQKTFIDNHDDNSRTVSKWTTNDDDDQYEHKLSLDQSNIHLINTVEKFHQMIGELYGQIVIAFDAEWKPTFYSKCELALIQLATEMKIFLIDVIMLDISDCDWNKLGEYIFNNTEILKIGFSPANDLIMFQKTIPALNLSAQYTSSYLDLQELWRKLNNMPTFRFPYDGDTQATALSALVQLCFGKKLNKSNQFSNWEKRPLRKDQMNYAALDAFCLIEIYNVIREQIELIGVDFNEFINSFITDKKAKIIIKKPSSNSGGSSTSSSSIGSGGLAASSSQSLHKQNMVSLSKSTNPTNTARFKSQRDSQRQ